MPILDVNEIRQILPHRYPMLLVDRIVELESERIVGIKNVTVNEPFFMGHFPDYPVMPGVLIVEAMAQTAGVLVLKSIPDRESKLVLLVSSAHLAEDETNPRIAVFPQNALPHCPLKANVWMLYEVRQIEKGRQNYVEGAQQVKLIKGGYDAQSVNIVDADDIAPAVWSVKVTDAANPSPATDTSPDLVGLIEHGTPRRLVFTDYLTATALAHWVKAQLANAPAREPVLNGLSFQVDPSKALTPFKHTRNDCEPLPHPG